jgi:hypothetical protein
VLVAIEILQLGLRRWNEQLEHVQPVVRVQVLGQLPKARGLTAVHRGVAAGVVAD